jgi:hypothetical protein
MNALPAFKRSLEKEPALRWRALPNPRERVMAYVYAVGAYILAILGAIFIAILLQLDRGATIFFVTCAFTIALLGTAVPIARAGLKRYDALYDRALAVRDATFAAVGAQVMGAAREGDARVVLALTSDALIIFGFSPVAEPLRSDRIEVRERIRRAEIEDARAASSATLLLQTHSGARLFSQVEGGAALWVNLLQQD